jgi:lysophospholipase L1-like esterase
MGYPLLTKAGDELKARGVRFSDLTHIFATVIEPLYVDDCCHLSGTGYDIIAQRIYDDIFKQ